MNERMTAWPWLAHSLREYGATLLVQQPGKSSYAQELLSRAVVLYNELGMESFAVKTQVLLAAGTGRNR
ncbi:MAG: hypothetical protein ACR2PL_13060 [Dehalococcoidia bacterium]